MEAPESIQIYQRLLPEEEYLKEEYCNCKSLKNFKINWLRRVEMRDLSKKSVRIQIQMSPCKLIYCKDRQLIYLEFSLVILFFIKIDSVLV
jgi:hypothetical protein